MSVLSLTDPIATVYSAFGDTTDTAKTNASELAKELTKQGHYVSYDQFTNKCREGVYSVSLLAKKKYYK